MNVLFRLLFTGVLFFISAASLLAQEFELQDQWWQPNGVVNTMVKQGDTLYVGGDFTYVSQHRIIGGGPIDTLTGETKHPLVLSGGGSVIYTSLSDGVGGWYIGGDFTKVGDNLRNNLAHIDSNGYVTPWNPDCNAAVKTIIEKNGLLYVGGLFTTVGGLPRTCLAAIDKRTGMPTSLSITITGSQPTSINALSFLNDTLYFGGSFRSVNQVTKANIASMNVTTGLATNWVTWGTLPVDNMNGTVYRLLVDSARNVLYVSGDIDSKTFSGSMVRHFARINLANGVPTWHIFPAGKVKAMAMDDNFLYLGGDFGGTGVYISGILVIDKNTGQSASWHPQLYHFGGGTVEVISTHNNKVYFGGIFTFANDTVPRHSLVSFDTQTGLITNWKPTLQGEVYSISHSVKDVFIGGYINAIGGVFRKRLAAFDVNTGKPTDFNVNIPFEVKSMTVAGDNLFIGGWIPPASVTPGLIGFNRHTGIQTWSKSIASGPFTAASVNAMKVVGNKLFIGGVFSRSDGLLRSRLAAYDLNTAGLLPWSPDADHEVTSLDNYGPAILIGGHFDDINNQPRSRVAMVDSITGQLINWHFPFPSLTWVSGLSVHDSILYVAGYFPNVQLITRSNFAAFNLNAGILTSWNPGANYSGSVIFADSTGALLGGNFTSVGGQLRSRFAMTDLGLGNILPWTIQLDNIPLALFKDRNSLYLGGMFDSVDNRYKNNMVVFSKPVIKIDSIQPGQHCAGDSIQISYHLLDTFNIGNVFTAELSSSNGNFEYPIIIGATLSNQSGTINLKLPTSLAYGEGYRIRLVSSSPVRTGSSNPNDIKINSISRVSDSVTACFRYINPLGILRDSSGFYTDTLQNSLGCDSIVTYNLVVKPRMDTSVLQTNTYLMANALNVDYQWYDCLSRTIIPGANIRIYIPLTSSVYAALLTKDGCTDTTTCIPYNMVSINELEKSISLFPNPNDGDFVVDFGQIYPEVIVDIQDVYGRNVYHGMVQNSSSQRINIKQPAGLYFINLRFGDKTVIKKLILRE